MAIRFISKFSKYGAASPALSGVTAAMVGSYTAETPVSGLIAVSLGGVTSAFVGQFLLTSEYLGHIDSILFGVTARLMGGVAFGDNPAVWTDTLGDGVTVYPGVPFSFTLIASDADGDPIDLTVAPYDTTKMTVAVNAQVGNNRTVTISGTGAGLVEGQTYDVDISLPQDIAPANALEDWLYRSGQNPDRPQPGIVWAHRFNDDSAMYWGTRESFYKDANIDPARNGAVHSIAPYNEVAGRTTFNAIGMPLESEDFYNGQSISWIDGALAGQTTVIEKYRVVNSLGDFRIVNPGGLLPSAGSSSGSSGTLGAYTIMCRNNTQSEPPSNTTAGMSVVQIAGPPTESKDTYNYQRVRFTGGPLNGQFFTVDNYRIVNGVGEYRLYNPVGTLPASGDAVVVEGSYTARETTDGIIGDGCLKLFCPAKAAPWCVFGRPLAPVHGETVAAPYGHLSYADDPAINGSIYRINYQQFFSLTPDQHGRQNNYRGGNFGNAAYRAEWGDAGVIQEYIDAGAITPSATRWYDPNHPEWVHSGRIWMQFRIKLSASKLSAFERRSKLMWPVERIMSGTDMAAVITGIQGGGTNSDPYQQPDGTAEWPRGIYTYRAQGAFDLEADMVPYQLPRRAIQEDFYLMGCSRNSFGALPDNPQTVCWSVPIDPETGDSEWITVMWSFDFGTDWPKNSGNTWDHVTYPPPRDTTIQLLVAEPGATAWTRLIDTTTWWWFGGTVAKPYTQQIAGVWDILDPLDPLDPGYAPRGFNVCRWTLFNGGSANLPVFFDQWMKIDQIIFSAQEIPLPVY